MTKEEIENLIENRILKLDALVSALLDNGIEVKNVEFPTEDENGKIFVAKGILTIYNFNEYVMFSQYDNEHNTFRAPYPIHYLEKGTEMYKREITQSLCYVIKNR